MKLSIGMVTAILSLLIPQQGLVSACCTDGCYAVKVEAWENADCTGKLITYAIGNVAGGRSSCENIEKAAGMKFYNDGCTEYHAEAHYFKNKNDTCHPPDFKSEQHYIHCWPKPDGATRFAINAIKQG